MNAVIFLFLLLRSTSAATSPDDIRWSAERKLTYADFKEQSPDSSPWAANTTSNIYFSYAMSNGKLNHVSVYATFISSKSWMKKKLPEILHHEQLHFDITELFARKFYAEALALMGSSDPESKLKQLFTDLNNECNEMQNKYDDESEHGVNEEEQAAWEKKVKDLLNDSAQYPEEN